MPFTQSLISSQDLPGPSWDEIRLKRFLPGTNLSGTKSSVIVYFLNPFQPSPRVTITVWSASSSSSAALWKRVYNNTASLAAFCQRLTSPPSFFLRVAGSLLQSALQRTASNRRSWTPLSLATDAVTCHSTPTDSQRFHLETPEQRLCIADLAGSSVEFIHTDQNHANHREILRELVFL